MCQHKMKYYLYLMPSGKSKEYLKELWRKLQKGVIDEKISDLDSLKYPPHVTLSYFELDEANEKDTIQKLEKYIQNLTEFQTNIGHRYLYRNQNIVSLNFNWDEMSERMAECQKLFSNILFITKGYHLTLFHNSQRGLPEDLPIDIEELAQVNFSNIVLWKTTEQSDITEVSYSWQSKKWEIVFNKQIKRM